MYRDIFNIFIFVLLQFTAAQPVILMALDVPKQKWRHPADDASVKKI